MVDAVGELPLVAGILFLLIALIGGGISLKGVQIPRVPAWVRVVSAVLGCLFTGYYFWQQDWKQGPKPIVEAETEGRTPYILYEQTDGEISPHGLQVRDLKVTSPRKTPKVGDIITVNFTLVSVKDHSGQTRLVATYISSEDPRENNRSFGWSRKDVELEKGTAVTSRHQIPLDMAGFWSFWPCYALDLPGGTEEDVYCRRWNTFVVRVAK